MGILNDIATFGQGATQGASQGMNLYDRYQEIQDKNKVRQREQAMGDYATQLHQEGVYEKDPLDFTRKLSQKALELGDIDTFQKYDAFAKQATEAKAQKEGLMAFAAGRQNPEAAIPYLNEMFKTMGTKNQLSVQPTATGKRLTMNIDGKAVTTDYTTSDMDKMGFDIFSQAEAFVIPPGQLGQLDVTREQGETEKLKATAQAEKYQADAAATQALLPSQIAENQAQAQGALMTGSAAQQRAATDAALAPSQMAAAKASAGADTARAASYKPYDPLADAIESSTPTPKVSDEFGGGTAEDPATDRAFQTRLAASIKGEAGLDDDQTFAATTEISSLQPVDHTGVKVSEKEITLPSGTVLPNTPAIRAGLMRVLNLSKDPLAEE